MRTECATSASGMYSCCRLLPQIHVSNQGAAKLRACKKCQQAGFGAPPQISGMRAFLSRLRIAWLHFCCMCWQADHSMSRQVQCCPRSTHVPDVPFSREERTCAGAVLACSSWQARLCYCCMVVHHILCTLTWQVCRRKVHSNSRHMHGHYGKVMLVR